MSLQRFIGIRKKSPKAARRTTPVAQLASVETATPVRLVPPAWAAEALHLDFAAAQQRRSRAFFCRLALVVGLPTLLMTGYVFWYASPRYVSEFQLTCRGSSSSSGGGPEMASSGLLSAVLGGGPTTGCTEINVLASYLTSSALVEKLDKDIDLRGHFSDPHIDWLDRLRKNATSEELLKYMKGRVTVSVETGGFLTIAVEAFSPKYAQDLGLGMVRAGDETLNAMGERARDNGVVFARQEMESTRDRLGKATLAVTQFQNSHNNISPTAAAVQLNQIVGDLEGKLTEAKTGLLNARTQLDASAPSVIALNTRIQALTAQLAAVKNRLASGAPLSAGPDVTAASALAPYSQQVAAYQDVVQEQEFAKSTYLAAMLAYDRARSEAIKKQQYVVSFVPPNLPQEATAPAGLKNIGSAAILSLFAYAVTSLFVGAFKDHAGI